MTAIGESRLRVLGFEDVAEPDSRGLFQQRDSWGPLAVRMDPTGSALLFLDRLKAVNGWESMAPSLAAHTVQVNSDITLSDGSVLRAQDYYAQFYGDASRIVEAGSAVGRARAVASSSAATILARHISKLA